MPEANGRPSNVTVSYENSFQTILDRLTQNAVGFNFPSVLEGRVSGHCGPLGKERLQIWKAKKGEIVVEMEIPAEMKDEVEKYHNELVEKIVENDDSLMEKYSRRKNPLEDLKKTLRQAVIGYKLVPVFCGSALKNKGVQFALDAVADYLPSPSDMPRIK